VVGLRKSIGHLQSLAFDLSMASLLNAAFQKAEDPKERNVKLIVEAFKLFKTKKTHTQYLQIFNTRPHFGNRKSKVTIPSVDNIQIHDNFISISFPFIVNLHSPNSERCVSQNNFFESERSQLVVSRERFPKSRFY